MKNTIIIAVLLCLCATNSLAAINAQHPRIWLGGSALARMQADVTANTTEWQALKTFCDSNLHSTTGVYLPASYNDLGWYKAALSYGLCFQATGNQVYGNEGVVYLQALVDDDVVVGDAGATAASIVRDSGYVARSRGTGVAVGRDWLAGASTLDAAMVLKVTTRMGEWMNYLSANPNLTNGEENPFDNYYAGFFTMAYTAGVGLHGDDGYDAGWLTKAETMWSGSVLPAISGGLAGGDWYEGWNYGPWAAMEYVGYPVALASGTDTANPWSNVTWHEELFNSHTHMLHPSRGYFSDDGSWSGEYKGDPRRMLMDMLASATPLTATQKGVARWFGDNRTWTPASDGYEFESFLWRDKSITPVVPTLSNMGALSWSMDGGHGVSRSAEWSDTAATWVEVMGRTAMGDSQSDPNVGEVKIASRSQLLVADGDKHQSSTVYENAALITGTHVYAPAQDLWRDTVTWAMGEVLGGTHFKVDHIEDVYNNNNSISENNPSADYYAREVLFIRPDYTVVYDNLQVKTTSNLATFRWFFNGAPTVSGADAERTVGAAKVFMTNLGIDGALSAPVESTARPGFYYTDFDPTGAPLNNQHFTVFETAASGAAKATVSSVSGVGGHGVVIGGTKVAMFTNSLTGAAMTGVSYTVSTTGPSTHYISDLTPSASYNVSVDGGAATPYTASTTGVLVFNFEASASHNYAVGEAPVVAVIPTTTPSRAPGRYTATQQLSLTASAGVAKYCFGAGCTPTATYSAPLKVLQNLARQTVRVQSVDGANVETVQTWEFRKQRPQ